MASLALAVEYVYASRYMVLLLAVTYYGWLGYTSYRRLHQFKGPMIARFTNFFMAHVVYTKQVNLRMDAITQEYGDLARVGPNTLVTCDPELVARMSSARSKYTKSMWYAGQKLEMHESMFAMIDEKRHTARRAQLASGYAGKEIDGLEAAVDRHLLIYISLITDKYISTDSELREMDMARKSSYLTLDIITDIAFGRSWGCLVEDDDVKGWFYSMDVMTPPVMFIAAVPWLANLINVPIIGKFIKPSDKDSKGPGKMIGIAREIVNDRFAQSDPGAEKDMMGSFLRHGLSRDEAVAEAILQIIAGSDTSATAIRSTLLFVITNVRVYTALQAEIDSFSPRNLIITDEEARTLPYLQAVIKEGARIWPVITGLLSKVVPTEGDTFKGVFIPGGTEIGQNSWSIQRSKKVYGEDSTIFRPERWLQAKGEKLEIMEKTLGLNWGHGKYGCAGKSIAMMELNKTYFTLLQKFDFELCDPSNPWESKNYSLWVQKEMMVRVTQRAAK